MGFPYRIVLTVCENFRQPWPSLKSHQLCQMSDVESLNAPSRGFFQTVPDGICIALQQYCNCDQNSKAD